MEDTLHQVKAKLFQVWKSIQPNANPLGVCVREENLRPNQVEALEKRELHRAAAGLGRAMDCGYFYPDFSAPTVHDYQHQVVIDLRGAEPRARCALFNALVELTNVSIESDDSDHILFHGKLEELQQIDRAQLNSAVAKHYQQYGSTTLQR